MKKLESPRKQMVLRLLSQIGINSFWDKCHAESFSSEQRRLPILKDMNELKALMHNAVRVVGFGYTAVKILRLVNGEGVDRVVVFPYRADRNDVCGPKLFGEEGIVHVRIDFELGSTVSYGKYLEERVSDFFAYGLHDAVVEGASRVFFFAPLPSFGGEILREMVKRMPENLSCGHITSSAMLQLPFPFEGRRRTEWAMEQFLAIAENIADTTGYEAEQLVNGHNGYGGREIKELFDYLDEKMAAKINERLKDRTKLNAFIDYVHQTNEAASSSRIHGLNHWKRVEAFGLLMAEVCPEADKEVISWFAYTHDSMRTDDGSCVEHGPNAAELIDKVRNTYMSELSDEQIGKLKTACYYHTFEESAEDITVDICFDSDRLDLLRCGLTPNPLMMASEIGAELAGVLTEAADDYKDVRDLRPYSYDILFDYVYKKYKKTTEV